MRDSIGGLIVFEGRYKWKRIKEHPIVIELLLIVWIQKGGYVAEGSSVDGDGDGDGNTPL